MNDRHHVIVKFGPGFTADDQGKALLSFERLLRDMLYPAEVFKATAPDDNKRRTLMTLEERNTL